MATLSFIEALPSTPERWEAPPVALTAAAVDDCIRRDIDYRLVTDFQPAEELIAREAAYWDEQLAWFDLLDNLLRERLPQLAARDMRPALLYGRWLKNAMDIVFICGRELTAALAGQLQASRVQLWRDGAPEQTADSAPGTVPDSRQLLFSGPSVYSRLLPLLCQAAGLAYEQHEIRTAPAGGSGGAGWRRLVEPVARRARRQWQLARAPRGRDGGLSLLFLHGGYDVEPLLRGALARGHRCHIATGEVVIDVSRRIHRHRTLRHARPSSQFDAIADAITTEGSPLWEWPNSWFGLPVSELLRPGVSYFLRRLLPELLTFAEQYQRFYEQAGVDFVVTPVLAQPSEFAAVDAARELARPQRVHIEHGDSAFDASAVVLFELLQFDHYFSVAEETAEFFRASSERYGRRVAEIHVGSYRWHGAQRPARPAGPSRRHFRLPSDRPTVVYPVTHLAGDHRYLNNAFYQDAWYYELQTRIVDVFARDRRFNFVIKLFPGPASLTGPLARYVEARGAPHLTLSRRPFKQWLPWADRVIVDFPATVLYETALADVPLLCLLFDGLSFRPGALAELEPCARWFHRPEDGARAVADYLDLERPPRLGLKPAGGDILEALERLAEPKRAVQPRGATGA